MASTIRASKRALPAANRMARWGVLVVLASCVC